MNIELRRIDLPAFDVPGGDPPAIAAGEYAARCDALLAGAGTDWVVVYGDREHNANLLHLTGFDPRFEEALLLLGPGEARVLVVGNEGVIHAVVAGLPLVVELAQSLSLMGQPRTETPRVREVLAKAGIGNGQTVAVVGWKYLEAEETDDPMRPAFVPALLVDELRALTGADPIDATRLLMHPTEGQRATPSAAQIAAFEWAAARVGAAVARVVRGARPGMSEREVVALAGWQGEPLSMHPIVASGSAGEAINGLRSASARILREGDGITCGIGYWGSLCCRAGLLAAEPDEAFLREVVVPYFAAQAAWYATIGIGVAGGEVHDAVLGALAERDAGFRPMLNPGHLIGFDEWVNSPIRPGSTETLRSGMVLQCDIIPTPLPAGTALNCEDSVALADEALRADLERDFPELVARVAARRAFMTEALGLTLAPEVLPLSFANAWLPPFWLDSGLACAVEA